MKQTTRVLFVEPHGEGGICHYTYCLTAALQEQGCQVMLATAHPYELSAAQRAFLLATPFGVGRARRSMQRFSRSLRSAQASMAALASTPRPKRVETGLETELAPRSGLAGNMSRWLAQREYRSGWRQVVRLARQRQIRLVHIQWLMQPDQDFHWLEALQRHRVRVVLTVHNVLPHDAPEGSRAAWQRIYRTADAVIVHYQQAKTELKTLGVDEQQISVIPHGNYLPIQALASVEKGIPQNQAEARGQLGLPPDAPVALFFGLIRPYKGVEYLLEAFSQVQREYPDSTLLLIGRALGGFSHIANKIGALGLEHACIAVPHYLRLSEIACYFQAADVVALPYSEASQSGVLQLAYAFQRPVIATRVGGLPEAIIANKTGILVPPRDADALASALADLLRDRQRCIVLGKQAQVVAKEYFSWESIARATQEIYQRFQ